jgi:hypothetical protein
VDVEERHTGKKLTDRRNEESAPSCGFGLKKKSGSKKEAVTGGGNTWIERNENREKKERKRRKTKRKMLGLATKPITTTITSSTNISLNAMQIHFCLWNTGCFKKSFTSLKAYVNLFRGHTHHFKCNNV